MRRFLALTLFVLVLLLIWPKTALPASWPVSPDSLPGPEQAQSWLAEQRDRLVSGSLSRRMARQQLAAWRNTSGVLAKTGGWQDQRRGYVIYPPRITLALFLLDRAERMYDAALKVGSAGDIPTVDELFRLGGTPLTLTSVEKYPSAARVRAALDSLALPNNVFRGYRVFLLPFAMGDVSGQGGPGFTFLAAEPLREQLIPNQLEVTLVHEFGHYLHLAGMPRETPAGRKDWQTYLALRGIAWHEDGRVKTADWARSPEETFAEDFRLLFGAEPAARESAATLAGDPRNAPEKAARLKHLMINLAAGTSPDPNPAPWPEDDGNTPLPIRIDRGELTGMLLLAGLVLTGYAMGRGSRRSRRPLPDLRENRARSG